MWEEYEKEQTEIRAPEGLKARTLEQMNARKAGTKSPFLKKSSVFLIACSFLAIFFINMQLWGDGDLAFERLTSNPRHFLPRGEAVAMEQFEYEVGTNLSQLSFTGLLLDVERSNWFWDEEDPLSARAIYVFSNGDQRVEIAIHYRSEDLATNSVLRERSVALYYHETLLDITYMALFTEGDHLHNIRGMGLTEEAFITYLEEILNFLE